ncbi:RluA family pseudouridine synthase [Paenibacillus radicis (ex Xue et al. 2023)]|uniref:Pseudouridine synthase n=1 Tax=Paenibacillus radicis (ex Xue et al. 2023) TaxID=2972489 RepID=A0ABT1Y8T3_9BACL|nr:RluA family pseudouridine synthase [Paenibacillus radicis (ex Xue et al. 2023)]MCR8629606.1 RluA family pseudouridine synthase [Paenibacillus radicis (ex Xue et al. 2023)]
MVPWQKKGEWLELRLPQPLASIEELKNYMSISDGFLRKLQQKSGISIKGQRIRLHIFPNESVEYMSEWIPLEVLYEDDFCLLVNKPAGLKVHGDGSDPGIRNPVLADAVASHYESTGQRCKVRHIHRLDEDTTGPVLYAKHEWSQLVLDEAMRQKQIGRSYVAIVQGRLAVSRGTIEAPIGKDRHHAARRRVSATGEYAVTHYEVIEQLADAALVRLQLDTGRTHQIRVHMSHLGHPIYGDTLYGGTSGIISRQALHGEKLVFGHPFTGEKLEVAAPWPSDFEQLYSILKKI